MNMIKDKAIDDLVSNRKPTKNYFTEITSPVFETAKFYTDKISSMYQKKIETRPIKLEYEPNTYSSGRRNEPIVSDMGIVGYKY